MSRKDKDGKATVTPGHDRVEAARPARPSGGSAIYSNVPCIEWPSILVGDRAQELALQFQYMQTQWWSPERIRAHQFAQLGALVRHAGETVPYYQALFKSVGFDHRAPLSEADWARLPILNRSDLQESFDALRSKQPPKAHGRLYEASSSGSTGTPIKVHKSALQQFLWETIALRDHLWHKRDLSARLAVIRNTDRSSGADYARGIDFENWGKGTFAVRTGPSHLLSIATDIREQVNWLKRLEPAYLLTHPSNLNALADYCLDQGITLPSLRQLRTVSEGVRPEVRDLCRQAFGCEIADIYSSEEVGYIALQSPVSDELLIQAETILVEVVREDGRPCTPGEVGHVVATPLHAFVMPLIRYAVGDLALFRGPASCGRGLPALEYVLGRERHMITLPSGERLHPNLRKFVSGFDKVRQFQVVRRSETLLELRLVARAPLDEVEEAGMRARVLERFKYPFDVCFSYLDVIPREPSGKFFDFKTEVG